MVVVISNRKWREHTAAMKKRLKSVEEVLTSSVKTISSAELRGRAVGQSGGAELWGRVAGQMKTCWDNVQLLCGWLWLPVCCFTLEHVTNWERLRGKHQHHTNKPSTLSYHQLWLTDHQTAEYAEKYSSMFPKPGNDDGAYVVCCQHMKIKSEMKPGHLPLTPSS